MNPDIAVAFAVGWALGCLISLIGIPASKDHLRLKGILEYDATYRKGYQAGWNDSAQVKTSDDDDKDPYEGLQMDVVEQEMQQELDDDYTREIGIGAPTELP